MHRGKRDPEAGATAHWPLLDDNEHTARAGGESVEERSFYLHSHLLMLSGSSSSSALGATQVALQVLVSWLFLGAQTITLFDLSYEEDMQSYKCLGNSTKPAVVICMVLVVAVICMKMVEEEKKCLALRLLLVRHASHASLYTCLARILCCGDGGADAEGYGGSWLVAPRLLLLSLFYHLRVYGVLTFVYVASIEQLMLFDTELQYIINSVIVLVLAEVDGLCFECLRASPILLGDGDYNPHFDPLPNINPHLDTPEPHPHPLLGLTKRESRLVGTFSFLALKLNAVAMLGPLLVGKLTGAHCSERSFFRVSEIGMFLLMLSRVGLSVVMDHIHTQGRRGGGVWERACFLVGSLVEHCVPCLLYTALMYLVFVRMLKPPTDDDLLQ